MIFSMLTPEFTALLVLVVLLLREIFSGKTQPENSAPWFTAIGGGLLVLATLFPMYGKNLSGFNGTLLVDSFALFFKTLFSVILLAIIFISREFFKNRTEKSAEFLMLLWCSLIGLFFLASANDFVVMFVALETFTLSLYVLCAYLKKESLSIEAGIKYLIMGSLASAFLVYGIALLFVQTGSTSFLALRDVFSQSTALHQSVPNPIVMMGMLCMLAGLGFKIASVPFHLWVPDVYEGAPTPVTAYLSTASKAAGFLLLMRLIFTVFPEAVFSEGHRLLLFSVLASMTMLYGNLGALLQTNIKRLFGYSSISHAGYLMIGLAAGKAFGVCAILYYLTGYVLSNLAAFTVITLVGKASSSDQIETYRGLGKRSPFLAGMLFLALLSLAGVPPLAGFFGKFLVLLAAVREGITSLAILGALLVAVSLYYYLNLVRVMYFSGGNTASDETSIAIPQSSKILLILLAAAIILTGLFQAPIFSAAQNAAASLF